MQKRWGIKQVSQLSSNLKVRNVWSFDDTNNNKHYVANVSGSLYEITKKDSGDLEFSEIDPPYGNNALLDREVSAFPTNNRLYILGGKKYLICYLDKTTNKLKIENVVGSEYVYTPTTTIGITPVDSAVNGYRQSLDGANLLTYWRKNKFITGLNRNEETSEVVIDITQEFQLDSPITFKEQSELEQMTLDIEFYDNDTEQFEVDQNSSIRIAHLKAVFCKGLNLRGVNDQVEDKLIQDPTIGGVYILVNYDEGDFNDSYKESLKTMTITCNDVSENEQAFRIYGYINLSGSVVLFNDYNNPNSENNCTFTFPCYNEDNYENNFIDTCFIGKVYNSNNINSLFVSGNPSYPSRDWHSETINASSLSEEEAERITIKDLVYFPDDSWCDYGEDNANPILGYDVLGTGDLLVMKKYQKYEPTIYFRTGQLVAVKSDIGETLTDLVGATLYEPEYSLTVGNIGVSLNDYMKITNYNGDTVFIGNDKKIDHLIKETKSYDNQRYAYTASYYIDKYLHDLDISNSFIYQDSDCLYFVNNNEMFINKYGEDPTDNYEWYHLTFSHNFISMFEFENKLYLSADNGKIFLFRNKNIYYDETYFDFTEGEVLSEINTNNITIPSSKIGNVSVGDIFKLNSKIKCILGTINEDYTIDLTNRLFTVLNTDLLEKLNDKLIIEYLGQEYILNRLTTNTFDISSYIPEIMFMADGDAYLLVDEFVIGSIDTANNKIAVKDFVFAENGNTYGRLFHKENVNCFYVTSPILFNDSTMSYFKNIWSITIANDSNEQNETDIEQIDNAISINDSPYVVSMKDNKGLNLANVNFNLYNLIQNKIPVKYQTIYKKILKRPYVVLKFSNNNDTNSVLSRISFVYSLGSNIR